MGIVCFVFGHKWRIYCNVSGYYLHCDRCNDDTPGPLELLEWAKENPPRLIPWW